MSLVFPLLLGGMTLVALPVLIHLVLRQKPKTLKFPAFRFLLKRRRTNLRKLRLRHLLLLALRMLLLVLICLALVRPKLVSDTWNLSADRPFAVVLLFDTSYSMQYKVTGGQTRLEEAKKRGLELLNKLPTGSKVAVLATGEPFHRGKGNWLSAAAARSQIERLQLRYASDSVTARIANAYELFQAKDANRKDSEKNGQPRLLCVFSDAMRSSWNERDLPNLLRNQDEVPPPLARLLKSQGKIPGRLELLKQLRSKLPPPEGQQYSEQFIIEAWQKLRPRINTASPENYPDPETKKLLKQLRDLQRTLIETIDNYDVQQAANEKKKYRRDLLDSLHNSQQELQGVQNIYVDVGVKEPVDLGILKLLLRRQFGEERDQLVFAPDEVVVLRALVQAVGEDVDATVLCKVGDQEEMRQSVALPAGRRDYVLFRINCQQLAPGPQQLLVRLSRPDLMEFSNVRFATFAIHRARPILMVTDEPATVTTWKESIDALRSHGFRCEVQMPEAFGEMAPQKLASYRAIYILNAAKPSKKAWEALQNYVNRGGNVAIVPPGRQLDKKAYNQDIIAKALLPGAFDKIIVRQKKGDVWNWDEPRLFDRPLFAPFRLWRLRGDTDFFRFARRANKWWKVAAYDKKSTVLIRYKNKEDSPAILERDHGEGKGKVVLLTTRLDDEQPPWNNYLEGDTSFCVVLPGELTKYLAGDRKKVEFNFICGDIPKLELQPSVTAHTFTLEGPAQRDIVPRPAEGNDLFLSKAVTPGNYRVLSGNGKSGKVVGAFSVNSRPEEALLLRVPAKEIERALGRGAVTAFDEAATFDTVLGERLSQPAELFPWLMIGLLAFLTLENLLSNLFYRRDRQQ